MKTKKHRIEGASLSRIEELDHLGTPDWVPYTVAIEGTETSNLDAAMVETQHFSGLLRECSRFEYIMDGKIEDENGIMHDLENLLDDAAERLDQAHQEWLEAQILDDGEPQPSITILWGESPEPYDEPVTYTFNTDAELQAFIDGIEAGDGWMNYEVKS